MLVVVVVFLPIVLAYTFWAYRVFRGVVTEAVDPAGRRLPLLKEARAMWYFSWILGLGLVCAFAILNAMWLELEVYSDERSEEFLPPRQAARQEINPKIKARRVAPA